MKTANINYETNTITGLGYYSQVFFPICKNVAKICPKCTIDTVFENLQKSLIFNSTTIFDIFGK